MRFGRIHRLMTDALAALGMLSLLSSGGLERYAVIALGVGLVAAMSVPEAFQHRRAAERLSVWGSLLLLTGQTARLFWGFDALQVAVEFAAGLQVVRIATRRGAAHDQQIVLPALLHLIAGTVLGGGMSNIERLYVRVPVLWGEWVFGAGEQPNAVRTRLVRAMHGDSSGVRGAAWLWNDHLS